ncbi:MAG: peptidase [Thermodesulfobacteriota bacterium]|nr:peptidase [Thermodesulfobacteriota bacterium]
MTFCLGMKVQEGLVGIADTLVTSGTECITARKISIYQQEKFSMFLMTSGLRSVRDKVVTYFDDLMAEKEEPFDRIFKAVNALAGQVRQVSLEDKEALDESSLDFNIHGLVGGQAARDNEPKLYLVYPQGNWVEVSRGTPYQIIGAVGYGKPVLDRTLKYEDSMRNAIKVGCLAFDSTRISSADVDFPVDIILYFRDSYRIIEHRNERDDLLEMTKWWQDRLRQSVNGLPSEWIEGVLARHVPSDNPS